MIERIKTEKGELILVGTAHISKESVDLVKNTIEKEKPDNVALELCEPRLEALKGESKWEKTPVTDMIKKEKTFFFLAYILLNAFQQKLSKITGVKPGSEMIAGFKTAEKVKARVVLVDRPIAITLKRAWHKSSAKEKLRLLREFLGAMFAIDDIDKEAIEELKKSDVISDLMEELGKMLPSAKRVLIDERDVYIASKLRLLKGKTVVVVGAGHVKGILKNLKETKHGIDIRVLETTKKRRFKLSYLLYVIPVIVIIIFILGFMTSSDTAVDLAFKWVVINAIFAAVGAAIALGHPFSIIAAAVASPFTSLVPFIGAGWIAGLVEAKYRKPTIADIKELRNIDSVRMFWKNKVTRVLLVAALANIGSMIGAFVAIPILLGGL